MKVHRTPFGICLFFVCIAAFLCGACATTKEGAQQGAAVTGTEEPNARQDTAAPQRALLDAMRIESVPGGCRLTIVTSAQPNYTIFKLSQPDRIIIDLLDAVADRRPERKELQHDLVAGVTTTPIQDKDRNFLRVEIFIKKDVAYNASTRDNSIIVELSEKAFHQSAAASEPSTGKPKQTGNGIITLKTINCTPTGTVQQITVAADGEIRNYKAFMIENPLRLVLDLPRTHRGSVNPLIRVDNELIGGIRTGQNNNDSRVVIDLKGAKPPYYQVAQESQRIIVSVSKDTELAAAQPPAKTTDNAGSAAEQEVQKGPPAATPEQQETKQYTGEKISFDFKDADIKNVLRLIADISGMNIIVGDRVTGKITLKLENIAWDEALDIILENNGLGKVESKNIVRIDTTEQIKKINEEKLLAKKSHEQVQDTVVKTFDISYAKAKDIAAFVKSMNLLTPNRGSVVSFELTNKLTVNDIPSVVAKVEDIIKEQDIPTRQVMIEARVVQTSPNYVKEMGIRWGGEYQGHQGGGRAGGGADIPITGTLGPDGTSVVDLLTAGNAGIGFGYIKDRYNLDVKLSALENEDKLKILSNPKILTLDNKESEIKQGVALPYLKLNENGVSTTEFKEAVLEMKVKPKITSANTIALNIEVKKDQKSAQTGVNNEPGIDVREIKTDLLVASGKTIVIGGIYENTVSTNIKKVPYLADIPFIGRAFRSEKHEDQLTELLVFLTVTVVPSPETIAGAADKQG